MLFLRYEPVSRWPSVALRRGRAYAYVGGVAAQVLSWANQRIGKQQELAHDSGDRYLGGLPAWQSWRYFRTRSGLQAIAERVFVNAYPAYDLPPQQAVYSCFDDIGVIARFVSRIPLVVRQSLITG